MVALLRWWRVAVSAAAVAAAAPAAPRWNLAVFAAFVVFSTLPVLCWLVAAPPSAAAFVVGLGLAGLCVVPGVVFGPGGLAMYRVVAGGPQVAVWYLPLGMLVVAVGAPALAHLAGSSVRAIPRRGLRDQPPVTARGTSPLGVLGELVTRLLVFGLVPLAAPLRALLPLLFPAQPFALPLGVLFTSFPAAHLLGGEPGRCLAEGGEHGQSLPEALPDLRHRVRMLVLPDVIHCVLPNVFPPSSTTVPVAR